MKAKLESLLACVVVMLLVGAESQAADAAQARLANVLMVGRIGNFDDDRECREELRELIAEYRAETDEDRQNLLEDLLEADGREERREAIASYREEIAEEREEFREEVAELRAECSPRRDRRPFGPRK